MHLQTILRILSDIVFDAMYWRVWIITAQLSLSTDRSLPLTVPMKPVSLYDVETRQLRRIEMSSFRVEQDGPTWLESRLNGQSHAGVLR